MSGLRHKLGLAACTLVAAGSANTQAADGPWQVDTSYLSYVEADDRVAVSKTLANLTRQDERGTLNVNLVHDTMSGASPTGAIRSTDSAVTYTSASGGTGFNAGSGGDYSMSSFEDTRIQAGLGWEKEQRRGLTINYGGAVSNESDYESFGGNVGVSRESNDGITTFSGGLALTADTIYRSDTGGTPEPLGNTEQPRPYSAGTRNTVDGLLGITRVLNKQTLAQFNVSFGLSKGYHSDPYKIISAADEQDRILANFHDSRPQSRLRTSALAKVVHQLRGSKNSVHLSYRLYQDDWGVQSHTADLRYRHQLTKRQYLEPHARLYRQTQADFYQRKLSVDEGLNPILPEDGFASSDYRLDAMTSATLGMKYGLALTSNADFRIRAEYLDQSFSTADYSKNTAVIFQTSLRYRF
ncbi:MAG: DUF3570 domain-containing protein [Granulosicoccus sp.]